MPRVHPRRRIFDGQVLDPIDWSEGWAPYSELLGNINEHNLDASDISANANIEDDFDTEVFGSCGSVGEVSDDALAAMYNVGSTAAWAAVPGNRVPGARQWLQVPSTSTSFYSDGGRLRVQYRVAFRQGLIGTLRPAGVKVGVRLDGGIISEGVIGGQDTGWESAAMEQGPLLDRHTPCREVTVPVSPGQHNLEVVFWLEPVEGVPVSETVMEIWQRIAYATLDFRVMAR